MIVWQLVQLLFWLAVCAVIVLAALAAIAAPPYLVYRAVRRFRTV